jgi:hypothetical protein
MPCDIAAIRAVHGALLILELEVAVDIRVKGDLSAVARRRFLEEVMVDQFAMQVNPLSGKCMKSGFRAFYRRLDCGYKVGPYNKALPLPTDQQLHGGRTDAAQVKAYLKGCDQGKEIDAANWVARIEVRLSAEGLKANGLQTVEDIQGFKFRKLLMPYFRHFAGPRPPNAAKHEDKSPLLTLLTEKRHQFDVEHYARVGMGGFLQGGNHARPNLRFSRDKAVNNRIGQALTRLERQHSGVKFVREISGAI